MPIKDHIEKMRRNTSTSKSKDLLPFHSWQPAMKPGFQFYNCKKLNLTDTLNKFRSVSFSEFPKRYT